MEKISERDNSDIDLNEENSNANLNEPSFPMKNEQEWEGNREITRSDKDIFETKKEEKKGKHSTILLRIDKVI